LSIIAQRKLDPRLRWDDTQIINITPECHSREGGSPEGLKLKKLKGATRKKHENQSQNFLGTYPKFVA